MEEWKEPSDPFVIPTNGNTSAKEKETPVGTARFVMTSEVNEAVSGGCAALNVSEGPPSVPNTASVNVAER